VLNVICMKYQPFYHPSSESQDWLTISSFMTLGSFLIICFENHTRPNNGGSINRAEDCRPSASIFMSSYVCLTSIQFASPFSPPRGLSSLLGRLSSSSKLQVARQIRVGSITPRPNWEDRLGAKVGLQNLGPG
jgi:hypothetical protein